MAKVIILQGIPGSGKSTAVADIIARAVGQTVVVVSADDYFVRLGRGTYKFDPAQLHLAHRACFRKFIEAARTAYFEQGWLKHPAPDVIIVDNTNTTQAEIAPYILAAEAHDCEPEIWRVECDVAVATARNVHGVPEDRVQGSAARLALFEPLPWWTVKQYVKGVTVHGS